jgi:hypothetical protein
MAGIATRARALTAPQRTVTNEDYPGQAMEENKGGRTQVSGSKAI